MTISQGFAIADHLSGDASVALDSMTQCIGAVSSTGQCMCSFVVTHFSTFGVGDSDVVATQLPASPRPENDAVNIIGPIVGGVLGGIATISTIAYFIVKMKKGTVQVIEPKTAASENNLKEQQQQRTPANSSATVELQQQFEMQKLDNQQQQQTPVYNHATSHLQQA